MSDTARCPHCKKYIDSTFSLDECPKCKESLKGIDLTASAVPDSDNILTDDISAIPSYIIPSIISIVFCGIFGIIATVYAILTLNAKSHMDYEKAARHSQNAKWWTYAAFIIGIVGGYLQYLGRGGRFPF